MAKSESIGLISKALGAAQAEIKAATFDSVNPFLSNKYASLGAVIEVIRPVLAKNGLSYTQLVTGEPGNIDTVYSLAVNAKSGKFEEIGKAITAHAGNIGITTVLMHESGEWLESTVMIALDDEKGKSSAQSAGSVITYLRRYSLAALFGVYAEEDVDGNKAQQGQRQQRQQQGKPQGQPQGGAPSGNGKQQAQAQTQAPTPLPEMTIEQALGTLTPGGHRIGELEPDKVKLLVTSTGGNVTPEMRQAAKLVLEQIEKSLPPAP